jgi:hypothetical protein
MTSLSLPFFGRLAADPPADTRRPAPRKPVQGPVLITDSVVPCDHATLLLRLWQDWERKDGDDEGLE